MFLGHGNAPWSRGILHLGQREFCSLVTSEVMIIFKFVFF